MIGGSWVTWQVGITPRTGTRGIEHLLDQAVLLLQGHRDLCDAYCQYEPELSMVTFTIRVRWGLTDIVIETLAYRALIQALEQVGFRAAPGRRTPTSPPHGWVQLARRPWAISMT